MNETTLRVGAAAGGVFLGALLVGILSIALSPKWGGILLDRTSSVYPLTIQNLMWLLFFSGIGDVVVRFLRGGTELRQVRLGLLPEDEETMLRAKDLGGIYADVRPSPLVESGFLQRLVGRVVLQFQGSRSVDQANALLNSSLELFQHELDLKYNMLRYLSWLIPTLGFIGTVVGIAKALSKAGGLPADNSDDLREWMEELTGSLALAFDTTLVALLLSAVLVFLMHLAQGREETALNRSGQYCLDNLINRLYEK